VAVGLVWAQARGGVIGADGRLPWHLPEDLRLFRELTTGSTVVMGRRTWESLPERFRPLPGRRNVVLTTDRSWVADGAERAGGVDEVLGRDAGDLWVIGGGRVYAAFLPYADRVVVTDVDTTVDGDTWAPELGPEWVRVSRAPETGWTASAAGLRYAVSEYARAVSDADVSAGTVGRFWA
jgi:dihydrofolate reductase